MYYSLIAGVCVILASILGSILGLLFRTVTPKINGAILGYAAGIMLAAAFLGLLPSGFVRTDPPGILCGVLGVLGGAFFISLMDKFLPHLHFDNGVLRESEAKGRGKNKILLLVLAIAIHNIPEGLATGIAFSGGMTDAAFLVAISMAIQKVPEGLIVIIPLLSLGASRAKALRIACLVSLMMLPGLLLGMLAGTLPLLLSSFFYAFTFGAIIYVISDEIIPESHEHGFQRHATFSLLFGILTVMLIEVLL